MSTNSVKFIFAVAIFNAFAKWSGHFVESPQSISKDAPIPQTFYCDINVTTALPHFKYDGLNLRKRGKIDFNDPEFKNFVKLMIQETNNIYSRPRNRIEGVQFIFYNARTEIVDCSSPSDLSEICQKSTVAKRVNFIPLLSDLYVITQKTGSTKESVPEKADSVPKNVDAACINLFITALKVAHNSPNLAQHTEEDQKQNQAFSIVPEFNRNEGERKYVYGLCDNGGYTLNGELRNLVSNAILMRVFPNKLSDPQYIKNMAVIFSHEIGHLLRAERHLDGHSLMAPKGVKKVLDNTLIDADKDFHGISKLEMKPFMTYVAESGADEWNCPKRNAPKDVSLI